jgi:hypothetical protein
MDVANRQGTLYYAGMGTESTSSVETSQSVRPPLPPKYEASEGEKGNKPGRDWASPSSFDSARFSQKDTTHKRSHKHAIWWLPEILSQVGGILCLAGKVFNLIIKGIRYRGSLLFFAAAICLVLWRADGKPPQALYLGITLNTALAFLTSLAKVAFLVPIVEGLGQLKWMRFLLPRGRRRTLIELQVFEEGSRGGLGCLKLFCGFKGQVFTLFHCWMLRAALRASG